MTIGQVGLANTDIQQRVVKVQQHDKREKLVEILNSFADTKVMVSGKGQRLCSDERRVVVVDIVVDGGGG